EYATGPPLLGVFFTDANTGTVVGASGTILRTTDGGTNWRTQSGTTSNTLYAVAFTDPNTGIAVGDGGTILRTTDAGATWTRQASGACWMVVFLVSRFLGGATGVTMMRVGFFGPRPLSRPLIWSCEF